MVGFSTVQPGQNLCGFKEGTGAKPCPEPVAFHFRLHYFSEQFPDGRCCAQHVEIVRTWNSVTEVTEVKE